MTKGEENKCHAIIHSCAAADGAGNLIPIPGTGFAADTVAMTTMAMSLASVFGKSLAKSAAEGIAIAALKKQLLKNPLKILTKGVAKYIPGGGSAVSVTVSIAIMEAAGWAMAKDFDKGTI